MKYTNYTLKLQHVSDVESEIKYTLETPSMVANFLTDVVRLNEAPQERGVVIALNCKGEVIGYSTVSIGTLTSAYVGPRNVFTFLMSANAATGIVAHNHPSGNTTFSDADIRVTRNLLKASKIMEITILDHIIVNHEGRYSSFNEEFPDEMILEVHHGI